MLANIAIHVLETMFLVGMAGSAIVLALTFVEDIRTLFGKDEGQ